MFLNPLLANSVGENVRMLTFRPKVLNGQVYLPLRLALDVVPSVDVLTVRQAQWGLERVYRPLILFSNSNARRSQTGHQKTNTPLTLRSSFAPSAISTYSASVVNRATHFCVDENHDTSPPPQQTATPETERLPSAL